MKLSYRLKNVENILPTITEYFKQTSLAETYNRLVEIFTILNDHNIKWADVHPNQFGFNTKGEIVAYDIDGFYGKFKYNNKKSDKVINININIYFWFT